MADNDFKLIKHVKGKSIVWQHFSLKRKRESLEVLENVAFCNRCQAPVKCGGGTTNLSTHLERHHKIMKTTVGQSSQKSDDKPTPPIKTDQPTVLELFKNSNTYWQSSERAKLITANLQIS